MEGESAFAIRSSPMILVIFFEKRDESTIVFEIVSFSLLHPSASLMQLR